MEDDQEPLDVEVEEVEPPQEAEPGTELELRGDRGQLDNIEWIDGVPIDPDTGEEIVLEEWGVAYQPHTGPVTSDVSSAATTGNGFSGAGFKWSKDDSRGGGGGGGGQGGKKRRRLGGKGNGGSGGGRGFHFSIFGGVRVVLLSNNKAIDIKQARRQGRPAPKRITAKGRK